MYDNTIQSTNKNAVVAQGLGKRYGELWALRDVDLEVRTGSILGLLGHNGAGKTSAIRILTTLALPSEGRATVAGFDVVNQSAQVRAQIGVAAQAATVDGLLTARANLEMIGWLYHLPRDMARRRADELLERVALTVAADRLVRTFSGGMRRRLDLAASLVATPPVLFLDEPTTGLDPQSRNDLWELLRELVRDGATLVLTTQYLEEADRLADNIVLLDHGRVAATGSPAELKARIGGERIAVTVAGPEALESAAIALGPFADGKPSLDRESLQIVTAVRPGTRLMEVVRALDAAGVDAVDAARRDATLDDVFLTLTNGSPALEVAA
ncbi:MAG TPA: ATP-binding cassette domain-containing protein [Thermoleophilaceae bacterium]|jgi:ABC-2 type transport system ATP-binding protein|nr:ATP-binding cassette domain-containing protein [Thermoleophilaceae bacterium]